MVEKLIYAFRHQEKIESCLNSHQKLIIFICALEFLNSNKTQQQDATGNCLIKIGKNELVEYKNKTFFTIDSPIAVMAEDSGLKTEKMCQFDSSHKYIWTIFPIIILFTIM